MTRSFKGRQATPKVRAQKTVWKYVTRYPPKLKIKENHRHVNLLTILLHGLE